MNRDTHAFRWFIEGSDRLSDEARRRIGDRDHVRFLSTASLWEMTIKVSLGKLDVPLPFTRLVREYVEGNAIERPRSTQNIQTSREACPFTIAIHSTGC